MGRPSDIDRIASRPTFNASDFQTALLHKSGVGRGYHFLGQTYPTASVKRYAKRGIVVEHGDADLELGDFSIEVPRHETLT